MVGAQIQASRVNQRLLLIKFYWQFPTDNSVDIGHDYDTVEEETLVGDRDKNVGRENVIGGGKYNIKSILDSPFEGKI